MDLGLEAGAQIEAPDRPMQVGRQQGTTYGRQLVSNADSETAVVTLSKITDHPYLRLRRGHSPKSQEQVGMGHGPKADRTLPRIVSQASRLKRIL